MQNSASYFVVAVLFLVLIGYTITQAQGQGPSVVGTYEYVLEGQEGMTIWTKTHFVWVITPKGRKPLEMQNASDSAKAAAFSGVVAGAGTYEFVGPSRIRIHRLYSSNPNLVGKDFTFEYEFKGDLCHYWILNPDGTRGSMGTSRRISK